VEEIPLSSFINYKTLTFNEEHENTYSVLKKIIYSETENKRRK